MMRQRKALWTPVVAWGIGLAMCFLLPAAWGQEEGAGADEAWKAKRTKLEEVIAQRIKEEVDKAVKEQDIAAKLGMKWPVLKPPKTKEEVEADVEKQIEELAAQQFPEARRQEFEKEAAEKYRLFLVGEEVSFSIRGGLGPNALVKGRLHESTQIRVRVGSRTILRSDMDPETQSHFWPDVNEEFRKKYIRVQNTQYDTKISTFKDGKREALLPEALRAARYLHAQTKEQQDGLRAALKLPEPTKKEERKLAAWFAERDVLDLVIREQRKLVEAQVKEKVTEQVYASNGYELVEDTINGTKEWMPKKQALTFRERLKELIEKKKQEELEAGAAKTNEDPWGAAPAGGTPAAGQPGMMGPGQPGMMGPGQPGMMGPGQPGMMGSGQPAGSGSGQPGMMGSGQPGMMGPGQPGMMGSGQPAGSGSGQPGMMGPGAQQGAPAGQQAAPAGGAKPKGGNNPFDENQ